MQLPENAEKVPGHKGYYLVRKVNPNNPAEWWAEIYNPATKVGFRRRSDVSSDVAVEKALKDLPCVVARQEAERQEELAGKMEPGDREIEKVRRLVQKVVNKAFGKMTDGEPWVEVKLVDRHRFQHELFRPFPYHHKDSTLEAADGMLDVALTNLRYAASQVETARRFRDLILSAKKQKDLCLKFQGSGFVYGRVAVDRNGRRWLVLSDPYPSRDHGKPGEVCVKARPLGGRPEERQEVPLTDKNGLFVRVETPEESARLGTAGNNNA
jgi:hypothetical protein